VYDFWNETYGGTMKDEIHISVAPHSVGLYRIQGTRPHPWLLSTDMHVLQGCVDIEDLKWSPARMTLSGVAVRPRGERGNVFLIAAGGWKPMCYKGLWVAKHVADKTIIVRKQIIFKTKRTPWCVHFEKF